MRNIKVSDIPIHLPLYFSLRHPKFLTKNARFASERVCCVHYGVCVCVRGVDVGISLGCRNNREVTYKECAREGKRRAI